MTAWRLNNFGCQSTVTTDAYNIMNHMPPPSCGGYGAVVMRNQGRGQHSNCMHNLFLPWGRRLMPGEGPGHVIFSPGAGLWGFPLLFHCCLRSPEVGKMVLDPGAGCGSALHGVLSQNLCSLNIFEYPCVLGREYLMDNHSIHIELLFFDLLSPALSSCSLLVVDTSGHFCTS